MRAAVEMSSNEQVMWTVMMVAFAAGIVVTLVALIKSYLRMREREREQEKRRKRGDSGGPDSPAPGN